MDKDEPRFRETKGHGGKNWQLIQKNEEMMGKRDVIIKCQPRRHSIKMNLKIRL
jgi:hypothetical protein